MVRLLGWQPLEGWWSWVVPGHQEPLHLVQEPMRQIQHRVRDSLRCHAMRGLEARRPATYGGLGDGVDGEACRAALQVASTELEASLLWGLLAGALGTAVDADLARPSHAESALAPAWPASGASTCRPGPSVLAPAGPGPVAAGGGGGSRSIVPLVPRAETPADSPAQLLATAAQRRAVLRTLG